MQNPFEIFDRRLSNIESILLSIKHHDEPTPKAEHVVSPAIDKIPITEIFKKRILSKKTLYQHVKDGKLTLYKLGSRSYVDVAEFNQAFHKVQIPAA
jgi:hypothetical protein